MPDLLGLELVRSEVDAVDHRVDRGDRVAVGPHDRRVVADRADHAGARAREQALQRLDQIEFAQRWR
jgi:hypothetical protein